MPYYHFKCPSCELHFDELLTIQHRDAKMDCPGCGKDALRQISSPNLAILSPIQRKVATINEKSQHEPRISSGHQCRSGCGCGTSIKPKRQVKTSFGTLNAQKKGARPWMLGH